MKSGLMEKEDFEKLGFTEESSWENEEAEQRFLFNKINKIKERAQENVSSKLKEQQSQVGEKKTDYSKPSGLPEWYFYLPLSHLPSIIYKKERTHAL